MTEAEKPRKPKDAKSRARVPPPLSVSRDVPAPPVPRRQSTTPTMKMTQLVERLEELSVSFDELPSTSASSVTCEENNKVGKSQMEKAEEILTNAVITAKELEEVMELSNDMAAKEASELCEESVSPLSSAASVSAEEETHVVPIPDLDVFLGSSMLPQVVTENPLATLVTDSGDTVEEETRTSNSVSPAYSKATNLRNMERFACVSDDAPPLYSDLVSESSGIVLPHREAPKIPTKNITIASENSGLYPLLPQNLHLSGQNLMTENQLLGFYHNELYEAADDFVDSFIENEKFPHNDLFEYLERYKNVCQKISETEIALAECESLIKKCSAEVWTAEKRVLNQTGKCGDQKNAAGSVEYLSATLHPDKVAELGDALVLDAKERLDNSLCNEIKARSIALQIQWRVVDLNNAFMAHFGVAANSAPQLISENAEVSSRVRLRGALSDLFYFLRFPALPVRFVNGVVGWITELCAVSLKACSYVDQHFILCQILRLVSPFSKWAAPLLQPFTNVSSKNDRLIIDNFVSLLSVFLSPIRGREVFLKRIVDFEADDNSWTILSDDVDEGETSLAAVSESDMIAILNQFEVEALFAKTIQHFSSIYKSDPFNQVLSLIAFELVLLKIFNDGLRSYSHPRFRQFCKQIGYSLKQSIKYMAEFWHLNKNSLTSMNQRIAQNEFDRIILQALYYVVGKQSLGLWQFLVDLPYKAVSESCRLRCQILLRRKDSVTPLQLYEIPDSQLPEQVKNAGKLLDRLSSLSKDDSNYMVTAISSVVSASECDIDSFVQEIFSTCFIDESARESFYKVGAEAIGVILDKHPKCLTRLISLIDRNMDSLEQYAVEILATAPLSRCSLSESDVGSICGKWLINRSPEHPASRVARRVLSSMNWGLGPNGQSWLPESVHTVCAETIVKGHMAQCKHTNGLIAKSFHKISKLASKVPDLEYQFDTFCWDVLLRLKLPFKYKAEVPEVDLTAYYVYVTQCCFVSLETFFSKGLPLWSELVAAGCYGASCVLLTKFLALYSGSINNVINNERHFILSFDRLLHCDQSSYAVELIAGSGVFPGPTLKLLEATITHYLNEQFSQEFLEAWIRLLCCRKNCEWNNDKFALYLLGVLCEFAFARDQTKLLGLIDLLKELYSLSLQQWREASRGLLAWFTSEGSIPAAIPSSALSFAPWASYTLLLAEERSYKPFYHALVASLAKHPKLNLEQCVKKASSKSHFCLQVERLHFFRWLEFACAESIDSHTCFPLVCQYLAHHLFSRHRISKSTLSFANYYFSTTSSIPLFEKLVKEVLPRAEANATKEGNESAIFYKAFGQWLTNTALREANFTAFNDLLLDHLVQFIFAGDTHLWIQYVKMEQITSNQVKNQKLYSSVCHWGVIGCEIGTFDHERNLYDFLASLSRKSQMANFPVVPYHTALPKKSIITFENACCAQYCLGIFSHRLSELCTSAREFVTAKDQIDTLDRAYVSHFPNLYNISVVQIQVVLRCGSAFGNRCAHPITISAPCSVSQFQVNVESTMNGNRQERSNFIAGIMMKLLDSSAVASAQLEYIANALSVYAKNVDCIPNQLKETGCTLFYHLVSSASSFEMIFSAFSYSLAFILKELGEVFIKNQASEQQRLMNTALNNCHLIHLLALYFTPECVSPAELVTIYTLLSQAVRTPSLSSLALTLLSRLDINNAGERLPSQQFSALMPFTFENLISVTDIDSPLYSLCVNHFIHALFYHFPTNFVTGISLVLAACDTNSTPFSILQSIIDRLKVHCIDDPTSKPEFEINFETSVLTCDAIGNQLAISRADLATRLFSVWSSYLDRVCLLSEFFLYKAASLSFSSQFSTAKIEGELRNSFERCIRVFGPLLEPFGINTAPWNPNDVETAALVVDRFTSLMKRLQVLYDSYLPPGSENLEAILWEYYATKIAVISNGCAHVYQLLESRFISISWQIFWPNLAHLSQMEKVLTDGAPECGSLVTQVLIRVPLKTIIHQQVYQQPIDGTRAFFGLLFSVIARCVSRPSNYVICPASLPNLFTTLLSCDWHFVSTEALNATSSYIASSFPASSISEQNDILASFFNLYRRVCLFSTVRTGGTPLEEEYQKQSFYLRTHLSLMLRIASDVKWATSFYLDDVKVVNAIITARNETSHLPKCLSREITACWATITNTSLGEALVKGLCEWIGLNSESHLVLLIMHTVVESLLENQAITGLKVVEKCITSFFHRNAPKWNTVVDWATIPSFCQKYLLNVPSSEKFLTPLLLTLNTFLLQQLRKCTSPKEETTVLNQISDYLTNLKPKYIEEEAAFVILLDKLQNLVIRQYGYSVTVGNEFMGRYLGWLEKLFAEEKNSSFFSKLLIKKQMLPVRTRLICQIVHLYLTQQLISSDQPPRNALKAPVLNSRIQSFNDLYSVKVYASHQALLHRIAPYFLQFETHHIGHLNELFFCMVKTLFTEKYLTAIYSS